LDPMNQPLRDLPGSEISMEPAGDPGERGFLFAGFRLEPDGTLLRGEVQVHLPPKELAALRLLLVHAGKIVTPLQMREALWGPVHVSADSVTKCVSSLRTRLQLEDCIQTIYKRGYKFTAKVVSRAVSTSVPLARLVVSPFATGQGVPEYLGSILAEETAAGLTQSRHPAVSVLAQDSVFSLAQRGLMAHEIGTALKADFVLTGTLRALPSHFRLGAEMIRVEDGVQVWAEDVLVDRTRIAGLEMELATRLNFRLHTGIAASQPAAEAHIPAIAAAAETEDQSRKRREAFEIFQSARQEWRSLQRHQMQEGLEHLVRAIELDPSLTGARVDLVNLCIAHAFYGFMAPEEVSRMVRWAVTPIADISGRAAAVLPGMGWISFHFDRDLPAALRAFSLSARLPHDPWITRVRAHFALSRHRFVEAIDLLQGALAADPYSPWLHSRLAWAEHLAGEARLSVESALRALKQFPDETGSAFYGSLILAFNGETKRAAELARQLETRIPYFDLALAAQAYALARGGRPDQARAVLEQLEWRARERFVVTGFNPAIYLELGQPDEALKVLRGSMESRCPWFFEALADPRLEPLRGRPEFQQLCAVLETMELQTEGGAF